MITAISRLRTLLTLIVPADTDVKKSQVMAAERSRATVAKKNQATAVARNRAMAVRSLLVMVMTLIPLAGTAVLKASSMVVSALSDLMALLAFLVGSVERRKRRGTARGGRSMAQVGMEANMEAPADTVTRVMGGDTKYDVPSGGISCLGVVPGAPCWLPHSTRMSAWRRYPMRP